MDLEENPKYGGKTLNCSSHYNTALDSSSSSPTHFVGDASSPGRAGGYFFSCPASPVHYVLSSPPYSFSSSAAACTAADDVPASGPFEFDGAAVPVDGTMTSADELFLNGKIRPLKLSSHLRRPQTLAPLVDLEDEEGEEEEDDDERGRNLRIRSRSLHRRTRSMSPLRSPRFQWQGEEAEKQEVAPAELEVFDPDPNEATEAAAAAAATAPESASSSRSSSGGRNSKRWIFLKDLLLNRSKSEGSGKDKDKFWHAISFSPSTKPKSSSLTSPASSPPPSAADSSPAPAEQNSAKQARRPSNGMGRRRRGSTAAAPSAHERHYTANRAQAEELRRRTFLPYRQGLLSCLGFTSRSYSAFNGLAKVLDSVTSR